MHAGPERRFRQKSSGIALPTALARAANNHFRGASKNQSVNLEISISSTGIQLRSMLIPRAEVPSVSKGCWATGGSGHPRYSDRSQDSNLFRFTADIPQIFS